VSPETGGILRGRVRAGSEGGRGVISCTFGVLLRVDINHVTISE
jgi:hypothetical protein